MRHLARTASLVILIQTLMACSAQSKGEKRVEGFADTRQFLAEAQGQVDQTIVALNTLRNTPADRLADAFKYYRESVGKLEKLGADAKWREQGMKEKTEDHIRAWQDEMKDITDAEIKASLQSRQDAVRQNFKLLQMYTDDARKAYQPFMNDNRQMVQGLSIDLSPSAVDGLGNVLDRVTTQGVALKQKIGLMQNAMDNIAQGKSALGL